VFSTPPRGFSFKGERKASLRLTKREKAPKGAFSFRFVRDERLGHLYINFASSLAQVKVFKP